MVCEPEIVDATSDSGYEAGVLTFGISVEGCDYCDVAFTIDIHYASGEREYQSNGNKSNGRKQWEVRIAVEPNVESVSSPRDVSCKCIE